jgi:hypothetical protein
MQFPNWLRISQRRLPNQNPGPAPFCRQSDTAEKKAFVDDIVSACPPCAQCSYGPIATLITPSLRSAEQFVCFRNLIQRIAIASVKRDQVELAVADQFMRRRVRSLPPGHSVVMNLVVAQTHGEGLKGDTASGDARQANGSLRWPVIGANNALC